MAGSGHGRQLRGSQFSDPRRRETAEFMSDHAHVMTAPAAVMRFIGSSSAWFVLVGMLSGYFALLVALGGHHVWDELGVPAVSPGFFDLRSLTSGWDARGSTSANGPTTRAIRAVGPRTTHGSGLLRRSSASGRTTHTFSASSSGSHSSRGRSSRYRARLRWRMPSSTDSGCARPRS